MADALDAFLAAAVDRPFAWGTWDCQVWLADWILDRRGVDPAAGFRGQYDTVEGAVRIIAREGGIKALAARLAAAAGLEPVAEPSRGDVGLVRCAGALRLETVGAIHTGRRWVALGLRGLVAGEALALAAWRV